MNSHTWFGLCLQLRPKHPDALFGQVASCFKLAKYEEAFQLAQQLTELSAWGQYSQAQALMAYLVSGRLLRKDEPVQ